MNPQDPIQGMAAGAIALHEMYVSFCKAGFTEFQALYLAGKYVEGMAQRSA